MRPARDPLTSIGLMTVCVAWVLAIVLTAAGFYAMIAWGWRTLTRWSTT